MDTVLNGSSKLHDVQVTGTGKRRRFTAEYKLKIVREATGTDWSPPPIEATPGR